MKFSTKSIAAVVAVVIIAGSAASLSGFDISGSLIGKEVPWWCIKYPVYTPGENSSDRGNSNPTPGIGRGVEPGRYVINSNIPDLRSEGTLREPTAIGRFNDPVKASLREKLKKLDGSPTVSTSGDTSGGTSGSRGDGTVRKDGSRISIPGVSIPGIPGVSGGEGGNGPSEEVTPKDGYWNWKLVCPDGSGVDYQKVETNCIRIKKALESGQFTEQTLPKEMKAMLPICVRHGSWFKIPKQSDDDCAALQLKELLYGWDKLTGEEASKLAYCTKMKPDSFGKTWKKFEDDCIEAKKTGKKLSPEMEKACGNNFGWWNTLLPTDDCKEIFKTMAAYKAAGGDVCDLPVGAKTYGCFEVYSELNTSNVEACYKGGGGG